MAKADRQRKAHLGLKKRKERKLQSGGFPTRIYQTTHVTGGTIMGIDPHTSVVSPHLQHWDAENLFVVGASNYPFNAGYNPTGPLGALALRLGGDLHSYVEQPRAL